MKTLSKQYEALGIAWRYNEFFKARIQLTLIYMCMVAGILGVFSVILLTSLNQQLTVDDSGSLTEMHDESLFFEEFYENLLATDVLILLVSGLFSFFLAGRTLRPIQDTLKQHEVFSSNVAHELRTPLAALYATTSATLRKPATLDEYKETLVDFKHETKRLIDLTEQLLKTTKEASQIPSEKVSLDSIAKNVVLKMQDLAATHQISISEEYEPLEIIGNTFLLEELFSNLIHNAIKFSHPGGVVHVVIKKNGIVQIIDTGIGIAREKLPHVFERFYTSDAARTEYGERGTGLGLSIVSHIARTHGAKLDIQSTVNAGTIVTLQF